MIIDILIVILGTIGIPLIAILLLCLLIWLCDSGYIIYPLLLFLVVFTFWVIHDMFTGLGLIEPFLPLIPRC